MGKIQGMGSKTASRSSLRPYSLVSSVRSVARLVIQRGKRILDFASGRSFLVDPADIKYLIRQSALVDLGIPEKPSLLDGDWDLFKEPIDRTELFKAFHHRFVEGGEWRDTAVYKCPETVHGRVAKMGGPELYTSHYEKLFESIRKHGYRTGPLDAVIHVHVGRDGELIRHDGWHRLTIARLLNIPLVRVKSFHRHKLSIRN